jgi:hypothetical protein
MNRKSKRLPIMLTVGGFFALFPAASNGQNVRLNDTSDWWSMNNEHFHGRDVKPQDKDLDARNFQIAGVSVNDGFEKIAAKFGRAKIVERGDASFGRSQVCYVSADDSAKVHLIFEGAEGEESYFYLFVGGADWKGSSLCVKSNLVSLNLRTPAGLGLGITPAEMKAILGPPDLVAGDRVIYSRVVERKATPQQFERFRKEYPEILSDKRAHEKFDHFPVGMSIEAKFQGAKLIYLLVSKTAEE